MSDQAYLDNVCELSRRGSMESLVELMKGYWIDKKDHPWHRLYKILGKDWKKTGDAKATSKKLMLLREGVFGALDILSLSLPFDFSTEQVLQTLTRAKSWNEGRQRVRSTCAKLASEMISSGKVSYLVPSGLQRDGFGFIVPELFKALLEEFRKAEPKVKKGLVNLSFYRNTKDCWWTWSSMKGSSHFRRLCKLLSTDDLWRNSRKTKTCMKGRLPRKVCSLL